MRWVGLSPDVEAESTCFDAANCHISGTYSRGDTHIPPHRDSTSPDASATHLPDDFVCLQFTPMEQDSRKLSHATADWMYEHRDVPLILYR